jgi:hypothetical protein
MRDTLNSKELIDFLSDHIQVIIADANEAGFGTREILAEFSRILDQQQQAYDADPDPAEDPVPGSSRTADIRNAGDDIDTEQGVPRAG